MPFMTGDPCKKCQSTSNQHRIKNGYLQSSCIPCEKLYFQEYQKKNLEYFRKINRTSYRKVRGGLTRRSPLEMTDELRKQFHRDKANLRATRAKRARIDDDLTKLVVFEAHDLRKRRNQLTGIEWHVDHIIPLKGENVCGLHIWNNLAVIPKVENLRKGNYHSIHD